MPRQSQAGLGAAIVAFAALLYCASAVDTTGMTLHGFKYVSNVEGYVNMTMDYCEIKAMLEGGNWTGAVDLFYNGKNSMRGATFRTFYAWGSDNHTGEPFFDKYRSGQDLEHYTMMFEEAVNSSNVPGAMKVLDTIRFQYMMHEWDEAVEKSENGLSADASGAPHNLDEAWAMYAGDELCSGATAAAQAGALGRALATQYMDGYDSLVNMAVLLAFRDAQYGAQNNMTEWVESAYQTVLEQYAIMMLQNLYLDATAATKAKNCNKAVAMQSMQSLAGTWSMLHPLLKVLDAPADTLAALDKAVMSGKPSLKPIQKAISDLKIRSWFIGYPTKRWLKEQLPGCF